MTSKNSTESPCPRCLNARLIPREPGAKLSDGRPDVIVCPRCLGAGPVAEPRPCTGMGDDWCSDCIPDLDGAWDGCRRNEPVTPRPPGVPLSKPGTLQQAVQEFASKLERVPPEIRALSGVPGEVSKPECFQARTYPLRHEVTERMDALTMRCLREAGVVA